MFPIWTFIFDTYQAQIYSAYTNHYPTSMTKISHHSNNGKKCVEGASILLLGVFYVYFYTHRVKLIMTWGSELIIIFPRQKKVRKTTTDGAHPQAVWGAEYPAVSGIKYLTVYSKATMCSTFSVQKISFVDPDLVASASICCIRIRSQFLPIRIRIRIHFKQT